MDNLLLLGLIDWRCLSAPENAQITHADETEHFQNNVISGGFCHRFSDKRPPSYLAVNFVNFSQMF